MHRSDYDSFCIHVSNHHLVDWPNISRFVPSRLLPHSVLQTYTPYHLRFDLTSSLIWTRRETLARLYMGDGIVSILGLGRPRRRLRFLRMSDKHTQQGGTGRIVSYARLNVLITRSGAGE